MTTSTVIKQARTVQELRETISYAFYRCLTVPEIVERLLTHEQDLDSTYVNRLEEIDLSSADHTALLETVRQLAARSEIEPSKKKAKIERTVLRILRLLPVEMSAPFVKQYFEHRLKGRRMWAYLEFRNLPISDELSETLAAVYRERGDQEALQLIARNPAQMLAVGYEFLLENLNEEYWRARVVEGVLLEDRKAALSLSERYPFEFAHAVGRLGDRTLLPDLCRLIPSNSNNIEFLSIYAYALGKLNAVEELTALKEYVDAMT